MQSRWHFYSNRNVHILEGGFFYRLHAIANMRRKISSHTHLHTFQFALRPCVNVILPFRVVKTDLGDSCSTFALNSFSRYMTTACWSWQEVMHLFPNSSSVIQFAESVVLWAPLWNWLPWNIIIQSWIKIPEKKINKGLCSQNGNMKKCTQHPSTPFGHLWILIRFYFSHNMYTTSWW